MDPIIPEVVDRDPFRDFALSARQYWIRVYEEMKDERPEMTLDEYLSLHWQNRVVVKEATV